MRGMTQTRLRSHNATKVVISRRSCAMCDSGGPFHLHCIVCRAPLSGFSRKTCSELCKQVAKSERRKVRTELCWIIPVSSPTKKFRRWIPKRLLHTRVYKASQTRRAILPNSSTPKAKRIPRG